MLEGERTYKFYPFRSSLQSTSFECQHDPSDTYCRAAFAKWQCSETLGADRSVFTWGLTPSVLSEINAVPAAVETRGCTADSLSMPDELKVGDAVVLVRSIAIWSSMP